MAKPVTIARLNAKHAELEELESRNWAQLPFQEEGAANFPGVHTRFGQWLNTQMRVATNLTNHDLSKAYNRLRNLRPARRDDRCKEPSLNVHPPKKEMAAYRNGLRVPGHIVAYRIGRALEQVLVERLLPADRDDLANKGLDPANLPEVVSGACCGLDALIMADCWPDAIACIGEFVGKQEAIKFDWSDLFEDTLKRQLHREPLPPSIFPALDDAWVRWITDPSPSQLPPRFAAAYILAKSQNLQDQMTAAKILADWEPHYYQED